MAKWGEGDPRWIVEERPDATNVNNWHWTEKNADQWSKKKLESLFVGLNMTNGDEIIVNIDEMEKCEGEARANNRKAKLIFFYEWELVLKWSSISPEDNVSGKITIPNLSEEHEDMADVDIEVSLSSGKGYSVKEWLRKGGGAAQIRKMLQTYVDSLKSEFTEGLILPKAGENGSTSNSKKSCTKTTTKSKTSINSTSVNNVASAAFKNLDIGTKVDGGTIDITERFKCTGQELYNVLTQKEMIQVFTHNAVKMEEAKKGATFELLDGNIEGQFVSLSPFSKIVQRWRLRNWPAGHFSNVEFSITQKSEDTQLDIRQTEVPTKEIESTKNGWSVYYIQAIKRNFGFGIVSL